MISRCPSCTAQVEEEAQLCPYCHWDFNARRNRDSGDASPTPTPSSPSPRHESTQPLEMRHFADDLDDHAPEDTTQALKRFNDAMRKDVPREKAPRRPRRVGLHWAAAVAVIGGATALVLRTTMTRDEPKPPVAKAAIAFQPLPAAPSVPAPQPEIKPPPPVVTPPRPLPLPPPVPIVKPPAPARALAPVSRPKPSRWAFYGTAYDVLTLHSVYLADLIFTDAKGREVARASTDSRGHFTVVLPYDRAGYKLSVRHPDYLPRFLDDLSPPIRLADKKLREQLAKALPENALWIGQENRSLRHDIVMIPATEN